MLKIIPLVAATLLALTGPLIAQDGGQVLRVIEAQDQIIQDSGQDPAHHRHRASRDGKRAGFCRGRFRVLAPDRGR